MGYKLKNILEHQKDSSELVHPLKAEAPAEITYFQSNLLNVKDTKGA